MTSFVRTGIILAFGVPNSGVRIVASVTVSLWTLARGECGAIDHFDECLPEAYRVRLLELGFHPGESVRCVQAPALGAPRVYQVANVTFSLDDDIAGCIHVLQVPHD